MIAVWGTLILLAGASHAIESCGSNSLGHRYSACQPSEQERKAVMQSIDEAIYLHGRLKNIAPELNRRD